MNMAIRVQLESFIDTQVCPHEEFVKGTCSWRRRERVGIVDLLKAEVEVTVGFRANPCFVLAQTI